MKVKHELRMPEIFGGSKKEFTISLLEYVIFNMSGFQSVIRIVTKQY